MMQTRNLYKLQNLKIWNSSNLWAIDFQTRRQQTTEAASASLDVSDRGSLHSTDWENARPYTDMPKESAFSLIRNGLPGGAYFNLDVKDLVLKMKEVNGPIFRVPPMLGRPAIVVTHNPEDFEVVYRTESIWPIRPGSDILRYHREKARADFYQGVEGLIPTQGKSWGEFRSAVNPVLMQPKNVRLYFSKMSKVNREFIERIRDMRNPETLEMPDNFENLINRWTLESVSVVALDKELGLLKGLETKPEATRLFKSLKNFFELSAHLELRPSIWRYIATPKFNQLLKTFDDIAEVTSGFVREAIERLKEDAKLGILRPEHEKSVLEKLLKVDERIAIVMAMDMLMAGVDTTSSAFVSLLLCLAKHPKKQEKLREEVRRILPEKDSEFSEANIKNAPYLRACIKESLRYYPLLSGNARVTERDCVLSGYRVPKGSFVSMIPLTQLRDDAYFPRANEYLPERWLRHNTDDEQTSAKCPANELKLKNPFTYLPFGFGSRSCIGKRIVDMELELGIARIIRNFKVEFNHPTENAFKYILISVPNIPLNFKFIDID